MINAIGGGMAVLIKLRGHGGAVAVQGARKSIAAVKKLAVRTSFARTASSAGAGSTLQTPLPARREGRLSPDEGSSLTQRMVGKLMGSARGKPAPHDQPVMATALEGAELSRASARALLTALSKRRDAAVRRLEARRLEAAIEAEADAAELELEAAASALALADIGDEGRKPVAKRGHIESPL